MQACRLDTEEILYRINDYLNILYFAVSGITEFYEIRDSKIDCLEVIILEIQQLVDFLIESYKVTPDESGKK